jgi:hypothetical protein
MSAPGEGAARGAEGDGWRAVNGAALLAADGDLRSPGPVDELNTVDANAVSSTAEAANHVELANADNVDSLSTPGTSAGLDAEPSITVLEVERGGDNREAPLPDELESVAARVRMAGGVGGVDGGAPRAAAITADPTAIAEADHAVDPAVDAAIDTAIDTAIDPTEVPMAAAFAGPRGGRADDDSGEERAGDGDTESGDSPTAAAVAGRPGEVLAATARGAGAAAPGAPGAPDGATFAHRVERGLELQDELQAQPVTRVLLRLDDEGVEGGRVRVGLQGAVVETEISLSDPQAAGRLQARADELSRALLRQGLDPGTLLVGSAAGGEAGEVLRGVGAGAGAAELNGSGAGSAGRGDREAGSTAEDEGRARDRTRHDQELNQDRSQGEQQREARR